MANNLLDLTYADVEHDIPLTDRTISEHDCIYLFRAFLSAFWAFYILYIFI